MNLVYVRTDRNGTKIYHDLDCPRCGGAGESDNWIYTGRLCYECGGTGKARKPRIVKEYTDEYAEKLREKAAAKAAKKKAERIAAGFAPVAKRYGFAENGVGYVYTGNTYEIRDQLKAGGAKYNNFLHWVSPQPIGDFPCIEIHADEVIQWFDGGELYDISYDKCTAWLEAHNIKF